MSKIDFAIDALRDAAEALEAVPEQLRVLRRSGLWLGDPPPLVTPKLLRDEADHIEAALASIRDADAPSPDEVASDDASGGDGDDAAAGLADLAEASLRRLERGFTVLVRHPHDDTGRATVEFTLDPQSFIGIRPLRPGEEPAHIPGVVHRP